MASVHEHLNQWRHNRSFLSRIPAQYADWQVTVVFYVALQAVDALLIYDKVRIHHHDSRNHTLKMTNRYQKIWRCYRPLYDLSRKVRYLTHPDQWISSEQIKAQVLSRYLYPIEQSVARLMNQPLDEPPINLQTSPGK